MRADKILFATDFSSSSEAALRYATNLARDTGALLLIVHVQEPPVVYTESGLSPVPVDSNQPMLLRMLHEVVPSDRQVPYVQHLLTGAAADEIVRFAEIEQVDMIVLGTHGRTGLSRLLMGSVAEDVVRHANCPVLTVKPAVEAASHVETVEVEAGAEPAMLGGSS